MKKVLRAISSSVHRFGSPGISQLGTTMCVVLGLSFLEENSAKAGCDCMMQSMGVGASYNKDGFEFCPQNDPALIFLRQDTINICNLQGNSYDALDASSSHESSNIRRDIDIYDINSPIHSGRADCYCCEWSLPRANTFNDIDNGSSVTIDEGSYAPGCGGWVLWNLTEDPDGCGGGYSFGDGCDPVSRYGTCEDVGPQIMEESKPAIWTTVLDICQPTYSELKQISVTDNYYSEDYWQTENDQQDNIKTLSLPFTDAMLRGEIIKRMPAWPATFSTGSSLAYYSLENRHICGNGGKMQYFVQVPDSELNSTYTLQWHEITGYYDKTTTSSVTKQEDVKGTGDPTTPATGAMYFVDMPGTPSYIYETAPVIIATRTTGDGPSGGPTPGHGGPAKASN